MQTAVNAHVQGFYDEPKGKKRACVCKRNNCLTMRIMKITTCCLKTYKL